jgi:hypothetical protein
LNHAKSSPYGNGDCAMNHIMNYSYRLPKTMAQPIFQDSIVIYLADFENFLFISRKQTEPELSDKIMVKKKWKQQKF